VSKIAVLDSSVCNGSTTLHANIDSIPAFLFSSLFLREWPKSLNSSLQNGLDMGAQLPYIRIQKAYYPMPPVPQPQPATATSAPKSSVKSWLKLARHPATVKRAALTALIVGSVLIAINHGLAIFSGQLDRARIIQMCLTVLVPYTVSTVSSVSTRKELARKEMGE
jgi:hypothetical protein